MTQGFNMLVNKLNLFRRKFYFFKLLRGILITLLISVVSYTAVSITEYFAYLPSLARTLIIYAAVILFILLVLQFILWPVFQMLRISKQMSNEKLSRIIVEHFPEIKDKLLNILELSKISDSNYSPEIVLASIDQKIGDIKIFDFQSVLNLKQLRFIFLYLIVSLGIIAGIVIFDEPVIAESGYRMINYRENFTKPAPFRFVLENKSLVVSKGDAFSIDVKCEGKDLPQVAYINIGGNTFLMKKKDNNHFEYNIESVINSFQFYFTDTKYISETYELKTLPKPGITDFQVTIKPLLYTNTNSQTIDNVGDLKIPAGTEVQWNFKCIDTDSLYIEFGKSEKIAGQRDGNNFLVQKRIKENTDYRIFIKNSYVPYSEVLSYSVTVIPDLFPEIKVVQSRDSSVYSRFYFKGDIADDYGFTRLDFHVTGNDQDSIFPLDVVPHMLNQDFYYTIDFKHFNFGSGEITYYFTVTDNDEVNGPKTTSSDSHIYIAPTQEEIQNHDNGQFAKIEGMADEARQLASEIKEGLKQLQYKNLDSNTSDWEKSQLVDEIINKKDQLEDLLDKIRQQNDDLNNFINSYSNKDQEILEKQAMIDKLLNEVFSDELKKLMDEFSKLADQFNERKFNALSDKMNSSMDDLSKQLDRNLEMLRRMKVEQKIKDVVDKMQELSGKEEKLSQDVSKEKNYEKALNEDQGNKEDFNSLKDELNDALDLNNKLKKPLNFDSFDQEFKDINQSFDANKENLEKKRKNKSSESIKNTSQQMNSLAFNMNRMLQSNQMQQNRENIANLRQILSNLIYFSFAEEDVMQQLKGMDIEDPIFNSLKRSQKNLQEQSVVIKDSLYALANREPMITGVVNKELLTIDDELQKTEQTLDDGAIAQSRVSQQKILTSVNNLALLLNEALDNLEKQMANGNGVPGDQPSDNPGQQMGDQEMDMLKQSSESIEKQLQKMIDEMKNGNPQNFSKMLGESLMQHEMMQKMLRDIMDNGTVGSSTRDILKSVDQLLEQNRKELMNKSISQKTIMRQNQIMSRLLDAEKSEIERGMENKRVSKTADQEFYSNPVKYFEYNKQVKNGSENLEQNIFKLNNFYNRKYKQYLNSINEQQNKSQ